MKDIHMTCDRREVQKEFTIKKTRGDQVTNGR